MLRKIPFQLSLVREYIVWRKVFQEENENNWVFVTQLFQSTVIKAVLFSVQTKFTDSLCVGISLFCFKKHILTILQYFYRHILTYLTDISFKKWTPILPQKISLFHAISQILHHKPILLVLFSELFSFFWQVCHDLRKSLRLLMIFLHFESFTNKIVFFKCRNDYIWIILR